MRSRKVKFTIRPQYFPDCWGHKPLSFAVYYGRTFLCYAFSLTRAWQALDFLRKQRDREFIRKGRRG